MTCRPLGLLGTRIVLGGALVFAGIGKLVDPLAFAAAIGTFQILPAALIPFAALGLPIFEIIVGLALLAGWRPRQAASCATILFIIYSSSLTAGLARGLPLECDCFGTSTSAGLALIRDIALLVGSIVLYRAALIAR